MTSAARDLWDDLQAKYTWQADGVKTSVRDEHEQNGFDYVGSLIYALHSGTRTLEGAAFGGGRIRGTGDIHYFLRDHLGSTRVVYNPQAADPSDRIVEQNDYYPFGGRHENSQFASTDNRFRFSGKEDQTTGGDLHMQDFGARMLSSKGLPVWKSIDPLAGKYYSLSPYVYCANNSLKYIDPFGLDIWEIDEEGRIRNRIEDTTQDAFYMVAKDENGNYQRTYTTNDKGNKIYHSISFEYGTVESQRSVSFSPDGKTADTFDVYEVRGDDNGDGLFEFLGKHVTGSPSKVEVSQAKTGEKGANGLNFITTSHTERQEYGMSYLLAGQLYYDYTVRELNHTQPSTPGPTGNDPLFKTQVTDVFKKQGLNIPSFNIFHVPSKTKIPY